jgi:hypothetical protein
VGVPADPCAERVGFGVLPAHVAGHERRRDLQAGPRRRGAAWRVSSGGGDAWGWRSRGLCCAAFSTGGALVHEQVDDHSDLIQAAERGDIEGGYIPGDSGDTLVTVPAKSFFGEIYVRGGFEDAAKKVGREITTKVVAPLPTQDRTGAVVGLLLLPTLIGGDLIATMLFSFTQVAVAEGRIAVILGFSIIVALITGASAGLTSGVPWSHVWTLLPCFALVTAAVALPGVAIQHLAGKMGTLLMAVLFIVIGGPPAGGIGVSLLPDYWQRLGTLFPPRHAVNLFRNVRYFDGHNIVTPIVVLGTYALVGAAVIILALRRHKSEQPVAASDASEAAASSPASRRFVPKNVIAPIGFARPSTSRRTSRKPPRRTTRQSR